MPPKYETRGVLAGRYRAGQLERVMHTHLVRENEETAICNKKIQMADPYSCSEAASRARPTCQNAQSATIARQVRRSADFTSKGNRMKLKSRIEARLGHIIVHGKYLDGVGPARFGWFEVEPTGRKRWLGKTLYDVTQEVDARDVWRRTKAPSRDQNILLIPAARTRSAR